MGGVGLLPGSSPFPGGRHVGGDSAGFVILASFTVAPEATTCSTPPISIVAGVVVGRAVVVGVQRFDVAVSAGSHSVTDCSGGRRLLVCTASRHAVATGTARWSGAPRSLAGAGTGGPTATFRSGRSSGSARSRVRPVPPAFSQRASATTGAASPLLWVSVTDSTSETGSPTVGCGNVIRSADTACTSGRPCAVKVLLTTCRVAALLAPERMTTRSSRYAIDCGEVPPMHRWRCCRPPRASRGSRPGTGDVAGHRAGGGRRQTHRHRYEHDDRCGHEGAPHVVFVPIFVPLVRPRTSR